MGFFKWDTKGISVTTDKTVTIPTLTTTTITTSSTLGVTGNFSVNTNKFTVAAATGNTAIAGTATVGGTLGVTGIATIAALLNANGGIAVDTDKFTVADSTGNTVVAGTMNIGGTLNATGNTTLSTATASGLVGSSVGSAAASTTALIAGAGTNASPSTTSTADKNFIDYRVKTTATSGDTRGVYVRTDFGGAGVSGESVRANSVLTAAANTVHGVHATVGCNSGGSITGLGVGVRAGVLAADAAMSAGTYAAVEAELWANGSSTDVSGVTEMSALRISLGGDETGAANIEDNAYAMVIAGGSNASGNMVGAVGNEPTWASNTYLVRGKLNGQVAYQVWVKV